MFHTAWVVQALVIFAKVAPAALAWKAGVSPAMVVQALVIFAKVAPVANAWRAGVSPASVVHALVFYCARGYYHRLAFRRRDACAPRLRSVTPFSEENYHRRAFRRRGRLRSLRSKAPSAVARLRSVHPSSEEVTIACVGCAGVDDFLPESPPRRMPGKQASRLRRLCMRWYFIAHEDISVDWRFAGETPALQAAQRCLRRLPGCAMQPSQSQKLPPPSVGCAGETPALQASAAYSQSTRKLPSPSVSQASRLRPHRRRS